MLGRLQHVTFMNSGDLRCNALNKYTLHTKRMPSDLMKSSGKQPNLINNLFVARFSKKKKSFSRDGGNWCGTTAHADVAVRAILPHVLARLIKV
jgi:hypothetical protein